LGFKVSADVGIQPRRALESAVFVAVSRGATVDFPPQTSPTPGVRTDAGGLAGRRRSAIYF